MALSDFLDQTCDLLVQNPDPTADQDEGGGPVREPHVALRAGVPCLVRELGGGNDPRNGKATMTRQVRVYFDPDDLDVPVTTRHLIRVTDGPALSGPYPRYLVVTSAVNSNSMDRLFAVDCEEQPV